MKGFLKTALAFIGTWGVTVFVIFFVTAIGAGVAGPGIRRAEKVVMGLIVIDFALFALSAWVYYMLLARITPQFGHRVIGIVLYSVAAIATYLLVLFLTAVIFNR